MSKTTLSILALGGAALSGAAATAIAYRLSSTRPEESDRTTSSVAATSIPRPPVSVLEAQKALAKPVDPNGVFQYGFPGPVNDLHPTPATTSCFDRRTRNPAWVAEHLTPDSLAQRQGDRKHSFFAEDDALPSMFRAKLADYHLSGYDRGHQVPAADAKWSQAAMDGTFLLTNICPQVGEGFNRDYWAHFEDFCRRLTSSFPSVRIVTGPLYLPRRDPADSKWRVSYEVIGNPPNVAVPTHFYKVIYAEDGQPGGAVRLAAFVLPNAPIANDRPLQSFEVPIDAVERASGLEFTTNLPPQRRRRLCGDVDCSILVREYEERQRNLKGLPVPSKTALARSGSSPRA